MAVGQHGEDNAGHDGLQNLIQSLKCFLDDRISKLNDSLVSRMETLEVNLSKRIDSLEMRFHVLRNSESCVILNTQTQNDQLAAQQYPVALSCRPESCNLDAGITLEFDDYSMAKPKMLGIPDSRICDGRAHWVLRSLTESNAAEAAKTEPANDDGSQQDALERLQQDDRRLAQFPPTDYVATRGDGSPSRSGASSPIRRANSPHGSGSAGDPRSDWDADTWTGAPSATTFSRRPRPPRPPPPPPPDRMSMESRPARSGHSLDLRRSVDLRMPAGGSGSLAGGG